MKIKLKALLSYYKPYKWLFIADMICAFIASGVGLLFPLIVRYLTENVFNTNTSIAAGLIIKILSLMLFLTLIEYLCNYFITSYGHVMGALMEHDMRNDIFSHLQKLSFTYYDNQKVGQIMSRITNDLLDITELCHHGPEDILISLTKLIGAFIILANIDIKLTLIVFAFIPFMLLFAYYYNNKMNKAFKKNREKIAAINAAIEDSLSGIRVVKSFANEDIELEKFKQNNIQFVRSKRDSYHYIAKYYSGINAFGSLIYVVLIIGASLFISNNQMNTGDLVTFLLYIGSFLEPVKKLVNFAEQFQNGITGFERFHEILSIHPDIEDKKDAIEIKNIKGNIRFENVSFHYHGTSDAVFSNINFNVKAGEYIALVGPSGVGKTTLCSLIPRFYEVSSGSIKIDNIDIRDIQLKSLRQNIGIVQQDVYLFAGTVMDNIRYGKHDATDEEIIAAAKNANAHDFIMALPNGYQTDIGQRGIKLSGGQKQRISIARVFLKNPPILIFDEATSALDNESEKVVQESLEKLARNRTTFVIAHRLSTIKNAQRIVVLTEEGITEEGTHEELLALNGLYAQLYNMQFQ
ncbi:MAG TPA: ABC transporter ATP-binding protein [Defluviitaleaceae bacterium]|nr:ABC transporter ATP-binding protein [Defluviitaleaceae bacterium]HPT75483.1 ABC transporter ATP-binding protein [Defluviitaleaceae bacterium]